MPDDKHNHYPVATTGELALFLGGSEDSFTGLLLALIAKADPGNRSRLSMAFPVEVAAWYAWGAMKDPRCCDVAVMVRQLRLIAAGR